jgi:hypothetical protein
MSTSNKLFQAASGGAGEPVYVEDVFSTHLYDGNGSTQTITNGIDLSGEGGLVWLQGRTSATGSRLDDTERPLNDHLRTFSTDAPLTYSVFSSLNSNGFSLVDSNMNSSGADYVSWSFRKQAGFFDVVTYTGNGTAGRTVSHNLNSVPGMIIVKRTDSTNGWPVYHRAMDSSSPQNYMARLNAADASFSADRWNNTAPTSTVFTLGDNDEVNGSGATYVAYLFAHDDQSFGDDSDEAIIKCGSFSGTGQVDVGFEPQFIIYKPYSQTYRWVLVDNMRGLDGVNTTRELNPNTSDAESDGGSININATGFNNGSLGASHPCIYIAIRRPMKTPEAGTEVFNVNYHGSTGDSAIPAHRTTFPVDMFLWKDVTNAGNDQDWYGLDRLRGMTGSTALHTNATDAESADPYPSSWRGFDLMNGVIKNTSTIDYYYAWMFKRATGFFDVVCFDGVNGATAFDHGLTVVPEMMIVKKRSATSDWTVYHTGYPTPTTNQGALNLTGGSYANASFSTIPTSTQFTFNAYSTGTQVAYLFATLAGVSKVGSVVHSGTTNVDCGFSAGARFVMAKRTDSSGDWFVWDSARGIVAGNDPYLLLNSTAAGVTNTDYIDPLSSGFTLTSSFTAGTYIFLAIA